jgi:hypothetical protein
VHCSQASGTQITARRPPELKAQMPFQWVGVDLFFFPPTYNGHKMAEIFKCEFTGLISAITIGRKSFSFKGIQNYEARLDRQFSLKVNIYRLDMETMLQKAFKDYCHTEGIIIE